jgi:ankyrin repeat protein
MGVVRELLAAGCDKDKADKDGDTPLHVAAAEGHEGVVRKLLAAGCDKDKADKDGDTPLHVAAAEGHEEVVRQLLAACFDKDKANDGGMTPLFCAAQEGHEGVVRELLSSFCDVSGVVMLEGHDNLKLLFRVHFQHLFFAFVMTRHTRLALEVSLVQDHCV